MEGALPGLFMRTYFQEPYRGDPSGAHVGQRMALTPARQDRDRAVHIGLVEDDVLEVLLLRWLDAELGGGLAAARGQQGVARKFL
jgi:hypothetical protein